MTPRQLKWIEIDLAAIRANIRWVGSRLKPGVALMAVVKADAYGTGSARIAKEALAHGASVLGVLTIAEAARLRESGLKAPIQILAPMPAENAGLIVKLKLIPTIDTLEQARALNAAAPSRGLGAHIDLDFGLGRWGLAPRRLPDFMGALSRLKRLKPAGLSAHIDYLPGKNAVEAEDKLGAFWAIAQKLKRQYPGLICHAANSSILMDFPHWQMDCVRVGNLMYGINPAKAKPAPLKNPWRFYARIIALQRVNRGQTIGYASEYIAPRKMVVATLPAGYADGLTLEPAGRLISFSGGAQYWGMLGNVKTPFVGRCGISHVLIDVTAAPRARIGDAVALPVRRTAANAMIPRIYL